MRDWNEFYRKEKSPYGIKPNEFLVYANEHAYLKPGSVLELGVGYGRNALYLAREGFRVTGLDLSAVAIRRFLRNARERRVKSRVRGVVADVSKFRFNRNYDNVVLTFMLHCLTKESSTGVLKRAREHIRVGGAHVVAGFLNLGPFYEAHTELATGHFLEPEELKEIYMEDGWKVVNYSEQTVQTHAKDKNGKPFQQPAAGVVAIRFR